MSRPRPCVSNVTKLVDLSLYNPCKKHECKPVIYAAYQGKVRIGLVAICPQGDFVEESVEGSFVEWNKHNPLPTFAERIRQHVTELRKSGI